MSKEIVFWCGFFWGSLVSDLAYRQWTFAVISAALLILCVAFGLYREDRLAKQEET